MEKDVSIITGAGKGIGRAIAEKFADEGHNVIIISRTENDLKELQEQLNNKNIECDYFSGDVYDQKFVKDAVNNIQEKFGKIDHLINNAGFGIFKKFIDSTLEEFQSQMNTNLFGVYNFTKEVLPKMIERKSGSIINISSLAGKNNFIGGTMYSATKHALMGFTKSLMLEVREYNIRVASVCPGSVETHFGSGEVNPINSRNVLMPEDIAEVVSTIIKLHPRALMSEIDIRPTNPKK